MRIDRAVPWLFVAAGAAALVWLLASCGDAEPASGEGGTAAETRTPEETPPGETPAEAHDPGDELGDHDGEHQVDMIEDRPIRGTVRMAIPQSMSNLNSIVADGIEIKLINRFVSFRLLEIHPEEIEPIPWLAASFPDLTENDRIQDWTLREGARWDDGSPVTGADVAFSWKLLNDPEVRDTHGTAAKVAVIGPIESVEATGERTFRVVMSDHAFLSWAKFGLDFPVIQKPGEPEPALTTASQRRMSGNGPYTVATWTPEQIVFERKLDWWGDAHEMFKNRYRVKRFIHKRVEDAATRLRMLLAGDLDITGVTPDEYLELRERDDLETAHYYLSQWGYIGWNCDDPIVGDVRVRVALSHLVQRKAMIEEYFHGLSYAVTGPFFVGSIFNDANIEPRRFSVTAARKLLEEAGWSDHDGDGDLDKDGIDLDITIKLGTAMDGYLGGPLKQFAETLAQVGIGCKIEKQDIRSVFGAAQKGEFQGYVAAWPVDPVLPDMYEAYHSGQIDGGNNWQRYRNGEMDAALETFRMTLDDAGRIRAARKIHRLLHEDQPMMFLFNVAACVAWRKHLHGVHVYPLGFREWDFWVEDD